MADVRSLLRTERASRRINHAHASYTDSGKLVCTVCSIQIKTESLWDNHVKSPQHTMRLEQLRAKPPPTQSKKRKAAESDDEGRKRVKAVPGGFVPEGFFDAAENEGKVDPEEQDPKHGQQTSPQPTPAAPAPAPAPAPDVNEDEWAAFEREIAAVGQPAPTAVAASATISAAPVSAEELAAQAREEQSAQRSAREVELEADTEDAARALEQEFDDMEDLDERVRKLREKREALRLATQPDTLPDAQPIADTAPDNDGLGEDEDDDDDGDDNDDDEFDDWTFGAR